MWHSSATVSRLCEAVKNLPAVEKVQEQRCLKMESQTKYYIWSVNISLQILDDTALFKSNLNIVPWYFIVCVCMCVCADGGQPGGGPGA